MKKSDGGRKITLENGTANFLPSSLPAVLNPFYHNGKFIPALFYILADI